MALSALAAALLCTVDWVDLPNQPHRRLRSARAANSSGCPCAGHADDLGQGVTCRSYLHADDTDDGDTDLQAPTYITTGEPWCYVARSCITAQKAGNGYYYSLCKPPPSPAPTARPTRSPSPAPPSPQPTASPSPHPTLAPTPHPTPPPTPKSACPYVSLSVFSTRLDILAVSGTYHYQATGSNGRFVFQRNTQ